jgi:hypothetical protein
MPLSNSGNHKVVICCLQALIMASRLPRGVFISADGALRTASAAGHGAVPAASINQDGGTQAGDGQSSAAGAASSVGSSSEQLATPLPSVVQLVVSGAPPQAYTAALVDSQLRVVDWLHHEHRLAR